MKGVVVIFDHREVCLPLNKLFTSEFIVFCLFYLVFECCRNSIIYPTCSTAFHYGYVCSCQVFKYSSLILRRPSCQRLQETHWSWCFTNIVVGQIYVYCNVLWRVVQKSAKVVCQPTKPWVKLKLTNVRKYDKWLQQRIEELYAPGNNVHRKANAK